MTSPKPHPHLCEICLNGDSTVCSTPIRITLTPTLALKTLLTFFLPPWFNTRSSRKTNN